MSATITPPSVPPSTPQGTGKTPFMPLPIIPPLITLPTKTPFTPPPISLVSASDYPVNDMERAQRFAKKFAGELKYVQAWKKWLLWDGVRWVPDEDGAVFRKAQEMPKLFLEEAGEIDNNDSRTKAAGAAIRAGD